MNISGIIVKARPQDTSALVGRLTDLPGVDVHAKMDDGRIVITVEDTPESAPAQTLMSLQNLPGVLSAAMVYNYCDE